MMYLAFAYSYPPENGAMRPVVHRMLDSVPDEGFVIFSRGVLHVSESGETEVVEEWTRDDPYRRISVRLKQRLGQRPFPDVLVSWSGRALKTSVKICRKHSVSTVLSFSYPHSAHRAAMGLKKLNGGRWIAYLADPLVNGIMYEEGGTLARKRVTSLERRIVHEADLVLTNSLVYHRQLSRDNPNARWLTRSYDPGLERITPPAEINDTVAHFGNIRGARRIEPWLTAVRNSNSAGIHCRNYGNIHGEEAGEALSAGIEISRGKTYSDYIKEISRTKGLILIVGGTPGHCISLPSKIIDYIGSLRPVFVFAPPESTVIPIAEDMGYRIGNIRDPEQFIPEYRRFISELSSRHLDAALREGYSPLSLKQRMKMLYDRE